MDEETIYEYMKQPAFKLAAMNRKVHEQMLDAMIAEEGITGGWFWQSCFPGCLPDGGPFASEREAIDAAQSDYLTD